MQQNPEARWGGGISGEQVERVGPRWLRSTVVPLTLILVCPPAAMLLWYTHVKLGGSLGALLSVIQRDGLFGTVRAVWGPVALGSKAAWSMIALFAGLQLLLLRVVPGRVLAGPVTPSGHVPQYRDNGLSCYLITVGLFLLGAGPLDLYRASIIYDHFGEILGALNVFSLIFCLLLYVKGRFAPSTADHGTSGNPIFDYYWGTELYPRLLGFDVKRFTNCRFGMMAWPLILLSFAARQRDVHGLSDSMIVALAIQFVYLTKFFIWEMGYLRSLDIMHDRAGFYICWGCLVWVPSVYTSATLYLVDHPKHLGLPLSVLLFVAGATAVIINYLADAQRQRVRATGGQTTVWGRAPEVILGHYTTREGEQRVSLLLCSGYWGLARHFHYVPEWLGALFWSLPAGFSHLLPYFYVIFLGVLLTDRAFRDDNRCAAKYGDDWDSYKRRVPYRIIPGVL